MVVAAAITDAFGLRCVTGGTLLECARRSGACAEVVVALERLPDREYSDLRQIWTTWTTLQRRREMWNRRADERRQRLEREPLVRPSDARRMGTATLVALTGSRIS